MADDRSELQASPAFAALKPSGKRVLRVIERECGGGAAAISLARFMESGMGRHAAYYGVKQCERLGFVSVSVFTGPHRANVFTPVDHWRNIDAVEAKRRMAHARQPKPPRVARPTRRARPLPVQPCGCSSRCWWAPSSPAWRRPMADASAIFEHPRHRYSRRPSMRSLLLLFLGIPIPIIILIALLFR